MINLYGKVIYLIVTGARKVRYLEEYCSILERTGAELWVIPTNAGKELISDYEAFRSRHKVKDNYSKGEHQILPQEDLIIVCPCTFNTFNKIFLGIADNYAMSIIHNGIGKGSKIIIAPAMDYTLWNNFSCRLNREKEAKIENLKIIFPEYIYDENYKLKKTTMAPFKKIYDSIIKDFQSIKYENYKLGDRISLENIHREFIEFKNTGKEIIKKKLTSGKAGFLAKKIDEGYLVTRTGACIGDLRVNDMVYVKDVKDNVVYWEGNIGPTSEFPIIYEIFSQFQNVKVIIHSHCPSITYNPHNIKFTTDEYISYGEWGEFEKINKKLIENNGFVILKLHGELSLGYNFDDALKKYGGVSNEK